MNIRMVKVPVLIQGRRCEIDRGSHSGWVNWTVMPYSQASNPNKKKDLSKHFDGKQELVKNRIHTLTGNKGL